MADVWFIRNVADTPAWTDGRSGVFFRLEPPDDRFGDTGINITVLRPGEPGCRYHAERVQEDFLVLSGECVAIGEDVEHPLRVWDLLHCPAGVPHVLVGAGDGPCAVLAIGARTPDRTIRYLVSDVAARYDASVRVETASPAEAYADWPEELVPVEQPWPLP